MTFTGQSSKIYYDKKLFQIFSLKKQNSKYWHFHALGFNELKQEKNKIFSTIISDYFFLQTVIWKKKLLCLFLIIISFGSLTQKYYAYFEICILVVDKYLLVYSSFLSKKSKKYFTKKKKIKKDYNYNLISCQWTEVYLNIWTRRIKLGKEYNNSQT